MVLPFTNLTGDPSHDYFIDGFTEELIAQLGHRCADRVGVLARTSAMLYKDVRRGAADIGEALRVDYLVEGSVRVGGNRVRITAQLIETRGETHLWAHSYDREYRNCLSVQTEVAAEIAVALTRELFPPARRATAPTRVPGAHEAYLTGRFHWNRPGPVGLRRPPSPTTIRRSPTIPASAAPIRRARAPTCRWRSTTSMPTPATRCASARDAAGRALAIDPDDGDALVVIAEARRVLDHDPAGARAAYEKVLALNPSTECALRYYAWFLGVRRRGADAIAVADRAFSLDPLCIVMQTSRRRRPLSLPRDYEGALSRSRHALAMEPDSERAMRSASLAARPARARRGRGRHLRCRRRNGPRPLTSLAVKGCALAAAGNVDKARAIARRLERAGKDRVVSPYHLAALHTALGDHDAAFAPAGARLRRRRSAGSTRSASIRASPACATTIACTRSARGCAWPDARLRPADRSTAGRAHPGDGAGGRSVRARPIGRR